MVKSPFKMIVYSLPGMGKTVLVGTIVDVPEMMPSFMFDIEGNTDSIESKCHYIDSVKEIKDAHDTKITCLRLYSLEEFFEAKDYVRKHEAELPYQSYITDSMTAIDWLSMRDAVESRPEIKRFDKDMVTEPDWGKHLVTMSNIFYHLLALKAHVVVTCHTFTGDKDGIIKPALNGQIRQKGPGLFKQVGVMSTLNTTRRIHFQPYGSFHAKDCSEGGLLGEKIDNPTFRKIYDLRYRKVNG